jgi:serine protease AprX
MTRYRVKAFFMHEREQQAAADAEQAATLSDCEWTDGYVIGVIDEPEIARLRQQGLVITPIEIVDVPEEGAPITRSARSTRGSSVDAVSDAKPLGSALGSKDAEGKILSPRQRRVQFYVVRLNGPLTEQRRQALQQQAIALGERLSSNKYVVRLEPGQVNQLAEQPFVDSIRLYSEANTLKTSRAASPAGAQSTRGAGRDAALHD